MSELKRINKYVAAIALLWNADILCAQSLNERVLVVYNASAPDSLAVAKYYMTKRQVPESNRCKITVSSTDSIKQQEYESRVKAPIQRCIEAVGKQKVLYIVFSYQTPYDILLGERTFALDSFVADIWDEYAPATRPGNEVIAHPYYVAAQSEGSIYPPFVSFAAYRGQAKSSNIYAVWRLDAATADLAKGLVDKAIHAETHGLSGKGCFDLLAPAEGQSDYGASSGDWDIHQAAEFARKAGFEVVEDTTKVEFGTAPAPLRCDNAALYAGWYDLSHYNDAFTWNPGAIGFHLDSASATNPRGPGNWSGSAVMKGITITSGAAAEPYLEGLAHPDQAFFFLFLGANAGDALLRSTRWLKWMILNIGDPLYRPFPKGVAALYTPNHLEGILAAIPQNVVGGEPASGLAAITGSAPPEGITVSLSSSRPDLVSVPKNASIAANTNSVRFPILTRSGAMENTTVRVTMTAGAIHRSNTLVVLPCMPALTLSQARVKGGTVVMGTATLYQPAPAGGASLKLTSDKPLVTAPAEVTLREGSSNASFQLVTHTAAAETPVTVTATLGSCSRTTSLVLMP